MKTLSSPGLRAVFVGTADGTTSTDRDHSGVLLEAEGCSLLLDCGGNAARHFRAAERDPDLPAGIWLSHMHSDHVGQFGMLIQSLWLRHRRAPLQVYGPAGVLETVREWLVRCILFPKLIGFPIEWHAVTPGKPVEHGTLTLTAFATDHLNSLADQFRADFPGTCFDCYGAVIEIDSRHYVYSADLAHPRELAPVLSSREVAGVICELAHFPPPELFAELARHEVKALWIVHYPDALRSEEKALQALAREENYSGQVHLVQDKVAVTL